MAHLPRYECGAARAAAVVVVNARRSVTWTEEDAGMPKFTQICASQDDLFALDEDGDIYRYNFNTESWRKLVPNRSREESRGEYGARASKA
jgi:hypothetical protein